MTDISNTDDVIDSRDVISRINELESEREAFLESEPPESPEKAEALWLDTDEGRELAALRALAEEASGYAADWSYGEALIRDSYFQTYAHELAEDCAPFSRNSPEAKVLEQWPYRCIDWEQAARELQMDYTAVDFDGVTYWVRA